MFDAYDIILSVDKTQNTRQDIKNLIFGRILLTFSINWWGWEGGGVGTRHLSQFLWAATALPKDSKRPSCLKLFKKSFKGMGGGRRGGGGDMRRINPFFLLKYFYNSDFLTFLQNVNPFLIMNTISLPSRELFCHKSLFC